jgi:hypothetical protein
MKVSIHAYDQAEASVLEWLGRDTGVIGLALLAAFRAYDDGAMQIVDSLVVNMLTLDASIAGLAKHEGAQQRCSAPL